MVACSCRLIKISRIWSSFTRSQSSSSQQGLSHDAQYFDNSLSPNLSDSMSSKRTSVGIHGSVQNRRYIPFLILRYHIGPVTLTKVLVTHSTSAKGTRPTFRFMSAELVGKFLKNRRNLGRNGKMSLECRLLLTAPISNTWIFGSLPLMPSRTMRPAVRIPS